MPKKELTYVDQCEGAVARVSKVTGVTPAAIKGLSRDVDTVVARTLVVHASHDHLGIMKARIADFLGQTSNAIYASLIRGREARATDKKYAKTYTTVTEGLK